MKHMEVTIKSREEYWEMRDTLESGYLKHINTLHEWPEEYLDILNWMNFYVSLEDKKALITDHKWFFEKLLKLYWEETVKEGFESIMFINPAMVYMSDMYLTEIDVDRYMADWLTWEQAIQLYRDELDKEMQ